MSPEFLLTTLVIVASPGPGVIYTLAAGLSRGGRSSVLAAFACTIGIVPHLVAAAMGLAALLHTSAVLYDAVKYAGVAYLLYMAWQSLREHGALNVERRSDARPALRILVDGVLINILNPKLSIFFVAFLPQFIPVGEPHPLARMFELSFVFMAVTLVIFAIYGVFAAAMRDKIITRPAAMAWIRRAFSTAFVALGAKLILSER